MTVSRTCWWKNEPVLSSSSPPAPDIPRWGSSAVSQRSVMPSCRYVAPCQGPLLTNSVSHPLPSHAVSACRLPATRAPSPPHTPCTAPKPAVSPGRKAPLPSSVTHMPHPTMFPSPGTSGRPFRLSSRRWSSGPTCRTALLGCGMPHAAILGPTTWLCRHLFIRGVLVPALLSVPALLVHAFHHILDPVSHHRIHHHIEDGEGKRVPLRHPPEALENLPIVPPRLCYHPQPTPVYQDETASSRTHAASL